VQEAYHTSAPVFSPRGTAARCNPRPQVGERLRDRQWAPHFPQRGPRLCGAVPRFCNAVQRVSAVKHRVFAIFSLA